MTSLWLEHLGIINTIYGLSFFVLGVVALILPRQDMTLPFARHLWLLGLFGVQHGAMELIENELLLHPLYWLSWLKNILLLTSFLCLLEFGRRVINSADSVRQLNAYWIYTVVGFVIITLTILAKNPLTGYTISVRYFIGTPAAILTGIAIQMNLHSRMYIGSEARLSGWFRLAAAAFVTYAILTIFIRTNDVNFPYWLPTHADFLSWFDIPVELARALCAVLVATALVVMVRRANNLNSEEIVRMLGGITGFVYRCRNEPTWTPIYINGKVESLCGYPAERFFGKQRVSWSELVHRDDAERIWVESQEALAARRDFDLLYRIHTKTGETCWVHERGRGICSKNGTLLYLEGHIMDATSLVEASEALRIKDAAIEASLNPLAIVDMQGRHTYVNQAYVRLWRLNGPEDILGHRPDEFAEDPRQVAAVFEALQQHGQWQGHVRARRPDGTTFDVLLSASVIRDSTGKAVNIVASFLDLTDLLSTEQQLRESSELLEKTQAMAHLGSWQWDIATGHVTWSDEQCRILGYEPGTPASYEKFIAHVHIDDREHVQQRLNQAIEEGKPYDTEFRVCHPNGEVRILAGRGEVRRDAKGKAVSMYGMGQDISERRKAENAVQAVRTQLQAIIDASTQVAIIAGDTNAKITMFNTGAERMLGYRAEEVLGKDPAPFHTPSEIAARAEELSREYGQPVRGIDVFLEPARRGDFTPHEWTYIRKDGSQLTVSLAITPLYNAQGELIGFLGIATDITQRAELLARLNKIGRNAPGMIYQYLLRPDGSDCFPYSSDGIRDIYDVTPAQVADDATPVYGFVHPDDYALVKASMGVSMNDMGIWHEQFRVNHPRKGEIWVEGRASPERLADGSVLWHGAIFDITEQKHAELALERTLEDLRMSEQRQRELTLLAQREQGRMAALLSGMSFGILFEDHAQCVEYVNPAFRHMWAIPEDIALIGGPTSDVLEHSTHRFARPNHASKHVLHVLDTHESSERFELDLYDGRVLTQLSYPVLDPEARVIGRLWIYEDVTHERQTAEQLVYLAEHDPLTGLHNRHRFQKHLEWLIKTARRNGTRFALLYFDLDEFKYINDTYGHRSGDTVLVRTSGEVANLVRSGEMFARLGGDEFALITELTGVDNPVVLAERITHAIAAIPFRFRGNHFRLTASIGIAVFPEHGDNAEDLVAHADTAMYQAKGQGKNTWALYDATRDSTEQMMTRMNWANRISQALEQGAFELHFQGVYRSTDRQLSHVEALVRMQDATNHGQLIMPGHFIPVAEKSGQILDIDRWVLRRSIETLAAHPDLSALAVNISGRSFDEPGLPQYIQQLLEQHAVAPQRLIIELTETAAVSEMHDAQHFIEALQQTGCNVSLDDFGSGFSTFAYLKYLGVQSIKIDGMFIRDLPNNPDNQAFVRAMVDVARGLGKTTVAEFVEDEATMTMLCELGVDFAQGFHLDRPCANHPGLQTP